MATKCVCSYCGILFERAYKVNRTRASRPQFCSQACVSAKKAERADAIRETRFWNKVDRTGECWVWNGLRDPKGYGRFQYGSGKPVLAHRYALSLALGRMPALFACHKCDNPSCVRPSHLFEGTQKDNMQDCVRKGRINRKAHASGERTSTAKLTAEQALAIFHSKESGPVLARRYGISKEAVNHIKRGQNWASTTGGRDARV